MICPNCNGSGVSVLDISGHNVEICNECDGHGYIALVEDDDL